MGFEGKGCMFVEAPRFRRQQRRLIKSPQEYNGRKVGTLLNLLLRALHMFFVSALRHIHLASPLSHCLISSLFIHSFWEANYNESRCSLFWRFLVANEGHLALAKEQLTRDIAWREEINLYELQSLTREQIVGVDDAFFLGQYPGIFLGY